VHIPDGWVDLPTSAAAGAVAVTATATAGRRAAAALRDRATTLPAVVAAYLLVAQLLVVPVGFGTSAHLIGTGLAALLVGPAVAIVCVAVVVVVQALVLADGGVTALGLNLVNDGLVPALVTFGLFALARPLVVRGAAPSTRRRRAAGAAGLAAAAGSLAAAVAATTAFVVGGTDAVPAHVVAASIGGAHILLAVVEGALTAAIVAAVLRLRPDMVRALPRPPAEPVEPPEPVEQSEPAEVAAGGGA
jgi:cobalt/nickel transport system permease protein